MQQPISFKYKSLLVSILLQARFDEKFALSYSTHLLIPLKIKMEAAISSVEYLSAVKLPFTHDTMVEVLERMEIYFSYVNEFLSGTDEKQDEIVNFIMKYKLFEKLKLFFMKVLDSYPSLFTAEVGDEVS